MKASVSDVAMHERPQNQPATKGSFAGAERDSLARRCHPVDRTREMSYSMSEV
jgi:hypothetical protein